MASDYFYFRGTAEWAKVQKPDPKYDVFTIDLYPDKESMKLFKDSGLQLEVRDNKKDPDKGQFIKFRRPVSKKIRDELVKMGPPTVLLKSGDDYIPFEDAIGNGSTVVLKIRVYDTMKGKGHELDTVAIETLVPFEAGETFTPGGEELPF